MKTSTIVACLSLSGWVAASCLTAWPVHAQSAESAAAAEALFTEGRKLMDAGNYAEACPKLAASNRLDPGAGTLLNLGACYEKNGQTASAWASYREAASEARKTGRSEWEEQARTKAAALEPGLSRLTIRVAPASRVPGLVVERDGVVIDQAQWDTAIPVDPGLHPVSATAPRKQQWATTVTVGPNGAVVEVAVPALVLEQGPVNNATPPLPSNRHGEDASFDGASAGGGSQKTIGLLLGGAGIVGLGVGGYFGMKASSTHDDALANCDASKRCTPRGIELDDQARTQATTATIAVGAGAALLAGGVILWLTAPDEKKVAAGSLHLAASPESGGASFSMGGAW